MVAREPDTGLRKVGRYVLFQEVAHGGMATVHLARLRGAAGFSRTVAIKRLHPPFARDPQFVSMFLDEARLAARIQHPNVVSVLDVVDAHGEIFLVMEYVHGEALSKLIRLAQNQKQGVPPKYVASIMTAVLHGLHAAHDARSEKGDPLNIVHRDVSPQNVLVGVDGVARVLDFGIAKAAQRAHDNTRDGELKGKLRYMAPEQVTTGDIDRRTDVYSASVTLWEALTGEKFFTQTDMAILVGLIVNRDHEPPSRYVRGIPRALDEIVMKGIAKNPADRYQTAREMALALERAIVPATNREIGEWVAKLAKESLELRMASISAIEGTQLPARASDHPDSVDSPPDEKQNAETVAPPAKPARETSGVSAREASQPSDPSAPSIPRAPSVPSVPSYAGVPQSSPAPSVPPRPPMARTALWIALGAAAVLLAGVVLLLAHALGSSTPAAAQGSTPPPPPIETPIPAAPVTVPPPPDPPADTPAATTAAATTTTARQVPRPPPPPPRPNCNPPYTIGADGVKIPKRQCF